MFQRSVVLLNRLAPERGAFPHALDIAQRLQLPIHAVACPGCELSEKDASPRHPASPRHGALEQEESRTSSACAHACARAKVRWEWFRIEGHPLTAIKQAVAPSDLLVFDQALPRRAWKDQFHRDLLALPSPILVCPNTWSPLTRALVVDEGYLPAESFLLQAAALCQRLEVETIVLTVATSERIARRRQATARSLLGTRGLRASFDSLTGARVRDAVSCVARWRHCQLVVLSREDSPPWWRWLRRESSTWLDNATEFASFLSLPGRSYGVFGTSPAASSMASLGGAAAGPAVQKQPFNRTTTSVTIE